VNQLAGDQFVRMTFSKRPLRQRVVALAAAYAIALSSLMTSMAAAQAAAEAIKPSEGILCHGNAAEQPAPRSDDSNGKVCVELCCVGCLVMAAAIPPQTLAVEVPHSLSQRIVTLTRLVLVAGAKFNSHRSRGPPPAR
jgi:hypothetical protein